MKRKAIFTVFIINIFLLLLPVFSGAWGAEIPVYREAPYAAQLYRQMDFQDIKGHWAAAPIYRMAAQGVIQGVGGGKFQPNGLLTKEEALALVLRIAGLEAEAQRAGELIGAGLPQPPASAAGLWSLGYIQVAKNRGIILPEEQGAFDQNRTKPAQRQEAAFWLARALEIPPVYGDRIRSVYSFSDWQDFKPSYITAIEPLLQQKIMSGYRDGTFHPRGHLTRGEMSAILDRISPLAGPRRGWDFLSGRVLGQRSFWQAGSWTELEVELDGLEYIRVLFPEGAGFPVLKNGGLSRASALKTGDRLELFLDPTGSVAFAAVFPAASGWLEGLLSGISADQKTLFFKEISSGRERILPLNARLSVTIDGRPAGLEDLLVGQEIRVKVQDNAVVAVEGTLGSLLPGYAAARSGVKTGRVKSLDGDRLYLLENGQEKVYRLTAGTQVVREGRIRGLDDLNVGDRVKLEIADLDRGELARIIVSPSLGAVDLLVRGRLEGVYPEGSRLSLSGPEEYFYGLWYSRRDLELIELAPGAELYLGEKELTLEELRKSRLGAEVYLALSSVYGSPQGLKLKVGEGPAESYNGFIDRISWPLQQLTLSDREEIFSFRAGTIAVKDGKLVDPADFNQGEHLFLEGERISGGESVLIMLSRNFLPKAWQVYRGRLDRVEKSSLEISSADYLQNNQWERVARSRRTQQLVLTRAGLILDAVRTARFISPEDLAESRWSEEY